ncbi:MAG: hypothetical protein IPJ22_06920 [Bacteroidetes bacterium]|nr:hypothetical protein [Bacteroidota bacterium]
MSIEIKYFWLTQKAMANLFDTTTQNITLHLKNIYLDRELEENATCKDFLQVQLEGKREVERVQKFYSLIINHKVAKKKTLRLSFKNLKSI